MFFVLDCSVVMAWCFEDESVGYADAVLGALESAEALVPGLWPLEVANILLVAERRGRLSEAASARFVELLRGLPISVDGEGPVRALGSILPLAREQSLSSYDAAYLELAMREGVPLATLDRRLGEAASRSGVQLFRAA
jgi:predicted nucleic acid-binding protein